MDLEEWDLLSDEPFLHLHKDHHNFSSKSICVPNTNTTFIDMNYFHKFSEPKRNNISSRVIPVPIQFHHSQDKIEEIPEEVIKFPIETVKHGDQQIKEADHQDTVSQVFFKKLKENEFVDMKMDSPKSLNRGILPQLDVGTYQFEELEKVSANFEKKPEEESPINKDEKKMDEKNWDDEGLNIWKWAMTGIGALFSFGFATATVSLIVLGNRHKESSNINSKNQQLHFQIYSQDKRLKQVVHHTAKINEAITLMRGAPVTRAHITIGGYYQGL